MRLSALNIWPSFRSRREQQEREVKEKSKHPKKVWNQWEHTGWGDHISFMAFDTRSVVGHTTPLPVKGDELRTRMESGKIGRFRFTKVEPCRDPSDMWFATVKDIGYLDEQNPATT